jgi:hypothetical protein
VPEHSIHFSFHCTLTSPATKITSHFRINGTECHATRSMGGNGS